MEMHRYTLREMMDHRTLNRVKNWLCAERFNADLAEYIVVSGRTATVISRVLDYDGNYLYCVGPHNALDEERHIAHVRKSVTSDELPGVCTFEAVEGCDPQEAVWRPNLRLMGLTECGFACEPCYRWLRVQDEGTNNDGTS